MHCLVCSLVHPFKQLRGIELLATLDSKARENVIAWQQYVLQNGLPGLPDVDFVCGDLAQTGKPDVRSLSCCALYLTCLTF